MISAIIRQQQTRGLTLRAATHKNNKTKLAGGRSLSSPAVTRPAKPIVTPKVGALVSRRQWNKLYKPPPRQPPPKDSLDDKPWPRSIQIAGYVTAATAIPYCIAWFISSNVTVRNALFPTFPGMESFLRNWFAHKEEEYYSYVDYRENGDKLDVPLTLASEHPYKVRKEQAELEKLIYQDPIRARIRVFTHDGFNLGETFEMPGDTPVKMSVLLEKLMSDRSQTIDPESVAYVAVDFPDVKESKEDKDSEDPVVTVHGPFDEGATVDLASHVAGLTKENNIYSKWHYQMSSPQQQQQQQAASSTKMSDEQMRISELEYQLDGLQRQLKDHTTMRSFDDIKDEISQTKSELRRLKWKRRLRFFS